MNLLLGTLKEVPFAVSGLVLTDHPFPQVTADSFWIERLQCSKEMLL